MVNPLFTSNPVSLTISNARNWPSPLKAVVTVIDSEHKRGSLQMLVLPWYFAAWQMAAQRHGKQKPSTRPEFRALLASGEMAMSFTNSPKTAS